ncbi:MAG: hypothetical protein MHM6MM_001619 [Cercozoa sp. M6MM]
MDDSENVALSANSIQYGDASATKQKLLALQQAANAADDASLTVQQLLEAHSKLQGDAAVLAEKAARAQRACREEKQANEDLRLKIARLAMHLNEARAALTAERALQAQVAQQRAREEETWHRQLSLLQSQMDAQVEHEKQVAREEVEALRERCQALQKKCERLEEHASACTNENHKLRDSAQRADLLQSQITRLQNRNADLVREASETATNLQREQRRAEDSLQREKQLSAQVAQLRQESALARQEHDMQTRELREQRDELQRFVDQLAQWSAQFRARCGAKLERSGARLRMAATALGTVLNDLTNARSEWSLRTRGTEEEVFPLQNALDAASAFFDAVAREKAQRRQQQLQRQRHREKSSLEGNPTAAALMDTLNRPLDTFGSVQPMRAISRTAPFEPPVATSARPPRAQAKPQNR